MSDALPSGWAKVILDDVVDVRDFEREPINSLERAGRLEGKSKAELFPYYGATGQVGWIDDYRSEGEQVLLGEDGAPFLDQHRDKAYIVNGRYWVNNHAHVLRGVEGAMRNRFLVHQLNLTDYHEFVTGSTRLKLTSAAMRKIPLLVPPHAEQARIVEKLEELLSDLDAGVAELKAAQRKLAQYRQSLLKAAVEGALTADWRAAHSKPQETGAELLQRILTERRARWEQKQLAKFEQGKAPRKDWQAKYPEPVAPDLASLPVLPQGWTWSSLDALLDDVEAGKSFKCEERPPSVSEVGVAKVSAVTWGEYDEEESKTCRDESFVNHNLFIGEGDFLFSRANTIDLVGACVIAKRVTKRIMLSDKILRLVLVEPKVAYWLLALLRSPFGRSQIENLSTGNQESMRNIGQERMRQIVIPLPPIAEVEAGSTLLLQGFESAGALKEAVQHSVAQLLAQRRNVLKSAFAGQLVPQDPSDEPASELLARIRAQRETGRASATRKRGRKSKETA